MTVQDWTLIIDYVVDYNYGKFSMNTCQNVVNVLQVQDVSFYTYLCLTDLFIEH